MPAGQFVQADERATVLKVPAAQLVQTVDPAEAENFPVPHWVQVAEFEPPVTVPA